MTLCSMLMSHEGKGGSVTFLRQGWVHFLVIHSLKAALTFYAQLPNAPYQFSLKCLCTAKYTFHPCFQPLSDSHNNQ